MVVFWFMFLILMSGYAKLTKKIPWQISCFSMGVKQL